MSQRTMKILSLASTKGISIEERLTKQQEDVGHMKNSSFDSVEDNEPVSNWVLEVDPCLLRQGGAHNEILSSKNTSTSHDAVQTLPNDGTSSSNRRFVVNVASSGSMNEDNSDSLQLEKENIEEELNANCLSQCTVMSTKASTQEYGNEMSMETSGTMINNKANDGKLREENDNNVDVICSKQYSTEPGTALERCFKNDAEYVANGSAVQVKFENNDQDYRRSEKRVNILSHWLLGDTGPKLLEHSNLKSSTSVNPTVHNASENSVMEVYDAFNNQIPLVVVPPKEALQHLPVTDDVPIILEDRSAEYSNQSDEDDFDTCFDAAYNDSSDTSEGELVQKDTCSVKPQQSAETANVGSYTRTWNVDEEVEYTQKEHYKDKLTFCFFCEKDVSHFSRHLQTWHPNEIEVQRIFSHAPKSKGRRVALGALSKKGNYLKNRTSDKLRPVKRVTCSDLFSSSHDFLPCPHCLGFYKRKSLFRHSRKCGSRKDLETTRRQTAQSDGHTALLMGMFKYDELLKNELFPRMRADEIALMAKKDILICNYAYTYMKGRRSKGNLDLVRQNVRRLSRLVLHAKQLNNEISDLLSLLRPEHFSIIVDGVNKIGGYNRETDIYESPTVAINFGTLIKKCCDLAYIILLQKKDTEIQRKELKTLKMLVQSQWANEVSAQACANLNSKKWNKEELLPLTSDLKKLKDFLEITAEKAFSELKEDNGNRSAYETLKEVLYSQIILMNRRRPAEVSQLKVQTYKSINLDNSENEFESCLTESEKILLNSCSRIVIRGKRGRGVPILLLSQQMRVHFDFLIQVRDNFVENNDYVFHTTGKRFIDGTKTLYKYALKCGADNPKIITATRLRKHLATVTQLLQFSKSDLEQLSRFMGHTLKTHCDFYRLPDSMYQTAKISKLLLLASEGGLEKYKGMQLDDIEIDLDPVVEDCELDEQIAERVSEEQINSTDAQSIDLPVLQPNISKKIHARQMWSIHEKKIIADFFKDNLKNKRAPKQPEVNKLIQQYPGVFENKKWTSIKAVVYNMYTGKLQIPK